MTWTPPRSAPLSFFNMGNMSSLIKKEKNIVIVKTNIQNELELSLGWRVEGPSIWRVLFSGLSCRGKRKEGKPLLLRVPLF